MNSVLLVSVGLLFTLSQQNAAAAVDLKPKANLKKQNGQYALRFSIIHDANLPVPSDPENQCNPFVESPELASDGLPYFASRYFPFSLPRKTVRATGFYTVGMNFNPCGHPNTAYFGIPHYDLHFFMIPDSERETFTCNQMGPICNFTEGGQDTSPEGQKFFDFVPTTGGQQNNMPPGYQPFVDAALPSEGLHNHMPYDNLPLKENWQEPVLIMGSYDSKVVFFEPMVPLSFVSGDSGKFYSSGKIEYVSQTILGLPSSYTAKYDPRNGRATFVLRGTSSCGRNKAFVDGACKPLVTPPVCTVYECEEGYTLSEDNLYCSLNI